MEMRLGCNLALIGVVMGRFFKTLKDSLDFFSDYPLLILPKLIVAALYSVLILATAGLILDSSGLDATDLAAALLLLVLTLILGLLDTFASSMYPFLVRQIRGGKKLDLMKGLSEAFCLAPRTMPPALIIEGIFLAMLFAFWIVFSFLLPLPSSPQPMVSDPYELVFSGFYILLAVAAVYFFYSIFPVAAFENRGIIGSLRRSVSLTLQAKADIAKATAVSFMVSGLSFALAFAISLFGEENLWFWAAFIIVRFLTAYIYAYLYVLNPVFYLNYFAGGPASETAIAETAGKEQVKISKKKIKSMPSRKGQRGR